MQDDQRSERRRLIKKRDRTNTLPSRNRSNSNSSAQQSIRHHRSPTLPSPGASSHNSIDSTLAQSAAGATYNHQPSYSIDRGLQYDSRYSVTAKTSTDLLGQRFDSAAILSNLNAVTYPADQHLLQPQPRPPLLHQHSDITAAQPAQLRYQNPNQSTTTLANPDVDLSQSLAATGRRMDDISGSRSGDFAARSPRQRLSDEAKDGKALKKKTGFSSFVNNLVGTPKRPAISAPENPVHVTHVGYDQETGEFTVSVTCRD